jgi:flagellar biosynthesis protein FliR
MSVLVAVLPFTGDETIPVKIKIFLSLAISLVMYSSLIGSGQIDPNQLGDIQNHAGKMIQFCAMEVIFCVGIRF